MADVTQAPTEHEENNSSENHVGTNGFSNGDSHTNGESKVVESEQNHESVENKAEDNEFDCERDTPIASSVESSPSKPKKSGGRVKSFFSHIFKRGKQDAIDSPKKKKKEKSKSKQSKDATNEDEAAVETEEKKKEENGDQPKSDECPVDNQPTANLAEAEEADVGAKLELDVGELKIDDCLAAVDKCNEDQTTESHVEQTGDEKGEEEPVAASSEVPTSDNCAEESVKCEETTCEESNDQAAEECNEQSTHETQDEQPEYEHADQHKDVEIIDHEDHSEREQHDEKIDCDNAENDHVEA